jgi:hypothetical protein
MRFDMENHLEPKQISEIFVEQKLKLIEIFNEHDGIIVQSRFKSWLQSTTKLFEQLLGETHSATQDFKKYVRNDSDQLFYFGDKPKNLKQILTVQSIIDSVIDEYKNKQKIQDADLKNLSEKKKPLMDFQKNNLIFISHITEDKDLAISLQELLRQTFKSNINIFVSSDLDSITFGSTWFNAIIDALKKCDVAIVFCNKTSISRPWINFEAGAAFIREIPTIPMCCDDLTVSELPSPLNNLQAANALNPNHLTRVIIQIAQELKCPINSLEIENTQFFAKVVASSQRARYGAVTICVKGDQTYKRGESLYFSGTSTVKSPNVDIIVFKHGQSWPPVFRWKIKVGEDRTYETIFDSRILDPGIYTIVAEGLNESSGTVTVNIL